ncbi:hypothetical protein PILCRDRAFT_14552 [Piloderma croceum F 1598]|uniref:Uncharacterized protein n=1 Tax=Piloderma croceum (strain F 1598) TaxID=765440 RepID=A0A0C3ENY0_PILCF|nr:hypothetical protein PILCRDRAFT_14552 [Piloderma croceum F 1598]
MVNDFIDRTLLSCQRAGDKGRFGASPSPCRRIGSKNKGNLEWYPRSKSAAIVHCIMRWPKYTYNLSRPYPGRYTTPIVTLLAAGTTVLLVVINIPLSGYETQQELTYTPNFTSTAVPYSNLIPAAFQKQSVDFIPHTFNIGDTFESDSSLGVFNYIMRTAYTREDAAGSSAPRPVDNAPSFLYMNNDLSTCDVVSITLSIAFNNTLTANSIAYVLVSCWFPLFYQFQATYPFSWEPETGPTQDVLKMVPALSSVFGDITWRLVDTSNQPVTLSTAPSLPLFNNVAIAVLNVTYQRCCATCNEPPDNWPPTLEPYEILALDTNEVLYYDHPTCDDGAVKFKIPSRILKDNDTIVSSWISFVDGWSLSPFYSNISQIWSSLVNAPPQFPALNNNALQALYHAVRLDLGIIRPNQIYNSPSRFNASISEIRADSTGYGFTNETCIQRDSVGYVDLSNWSKRVPKILYLTPVCGKRAALSLLHLLGHDLNKQCIVPVPLADILSTKTTHAKILTKVINC